MNIAVIGAGASGIICALKLKQLNPDLGVYLIEKNEKIGKKILATGNGKCNIMHNPILSSFYNDEEIINQLLSEVDEHKLAKYFEELGLFTYKDEEGRMYPLSNSSNNVVFLLESLLYLHKVNLLLNTQVHQVLLKNGKYQINNLDILFDYVVFATGSKANLTKDIDAPYEAITKLAIKMKPLQPSLVGLKLNNVKAISGVRIKAKAYLYHFDKLISYERGEVIFKDEGISGICVMNLSSFIARKFDYNYSLKLDLIPYMPYKMLDDIIKYQLKIDPNRKTIKFLYGIFTKKLADYLYNKYQFPNNLKDTSNLDFIDQIKYLTFKVEDLYGFNQAQVVSGGISLKEVEKFKIVKYPNMYAIGEVLDIDGQCGGYNLFYAFASGYYVSLRIAGEINAFNRI